jgi:hypothetical protein
MSVLAVDIKASSARPHPLIPSLPFQFRLAVRPATARPFDPVELPRKDVEHLLLTELHDVGDRSPVATCLPLRRGLPPEIQIALVSLRHKVAKRIVVEYLDVELFCQDSVGLWAAGYCFVEKAGCAVLVGREGSGDGRSDGVEAAPELGVGADIE